MGDTPHVFVKVESESLTAKAEEISGAWPVVPASPIPPCMLLVAGQGARIIQTSRDRLEGVIKAGEAEAKRLAECLRAAATAYKTMEDRAAAALAQTMSDGGGGAAPNLEAVSVNPNLPPSVPAPFGQNPEKPNPGDHVDWPNAVDLIAATDQGASLRNFAEGLDKLASELKERATKFSMGNTSWEGAAAEAAEGALRRHESWIYEVVAKAEALAKETRKLDDVHLAERGTHPDAIEKKHFFEQDLDYQVAHYQEYQDKSGESQTRYANGASLNDVYAPDPPDGAYPAAPVKAADVPERKPQTPGGASGHTPGGGAGSGGAPSSGGPATGESPSAGRSGNEPSVSPASANSSGEQAKSGSPSGGGGSPSGGGGSPAGGSGSPAGAGGGLPKGLGGMPGLPSLDDPTLSPAGLGGGGSGGGMGGGGGGGGMPSSPLGPPVSAETVAASPAGVRGPGGPGGAPGAGGGMGGGMGGGGAGGHGQGQGGKEKRRDPNLTPDEDLYVEDRAHTEGVIGLQSRRKRSPQEGNDK